MTPGWWIVPGALLGLVVWIFAIIGAVSVFA